jgi:hypothetical protein
LYLQGLRRFFGVALWLQKCRFEAFKKPKQGAEKTNVFLILNKKNRTENHFLKPQFPLARH